MCQEGEKREGAGEDQAVRGGNAGRLVLVYLVQVRGFDPVVGRLDVLVSRGKKNRKNVVDTSTAVVVTVRGRIHATQIPIKTNLAHFGVQV